MFELKKYYLDINSWVFPDKGTFHRGMVAALGKIEEYSSNISHVCVGSVDQHEEVRKMIDRVPDGLRDRVEKNILYVTSLDQIPSTKTGWFDYYIMTMSSETDYQPLVDHLNGVCLIIDGECEAGWVKLCEDLGMTCGAWDNEGLIKRVPLGTFRNEVAKARASHRSSSNNW
ncbi:hypothetical protein HY844_01430 [Candidatus Berkelbacteria bacterium]|nr:hypothetical protein [Candidatus Berkelbacteria bacterium]